MRHVNARDVLPEKVLRLVQRYCAGYIYVPSTRESWRRSRSGVLALQEKGLPVRAIAERVHLSERRVRQILAEERGRK